MTYQSYFKSLLLSLFLCSHIGSATTDFLLPEPNSDEENDAPAISISSLNENFLEEILLELQHQIQTIIFTVQQVEMTIAQKKIKITREEHESITETLAVIKQTLQQIQYEGLKYATPEAIVQSSYLIAYITLYLKDAFNDITNVSVETFFEMIQSTLQKIAMKNGEFGFEAIESRVEKNTKLIESLVEKSENFGLSQFNIAWRKIWKNKWTGRASTALKYSILTFFAYELAIHTLDPHGVLPKWTGCEKKSKNFLLDG